MSEQEKQEILDELLSSLRTNSVLITDLTEVQSLPENCYIELSGGKRIRADVFQDVIREAIYSALIDAINTKLSADSVVQVTGESTTLVMSQAAVTSLLTALSEEVGHIDFELGTGAQDKIVLVFKDKDNTAHSITLNAATRSSAGAMSAQQAKDLEDVMLEVYPLQASFSASNAGVYEKGQSVTPSATIAVTRRGVSVLSEATITTPMTVASNQLSYEAVTENTSLNVSVSHEGSVVTLPALRYTFLNYVYGEVLSDVPADIAQAIAGASTLAELSDRTTYEGSLAANKLFLFAVPGNVNLVCRHAGTDSIITGCTTGTVENLPRQNNTGSDLYSYIIVPSSDIAWNFKITNS